MKHSWAKAILSLSVVAVLISAPVCYWLSGPITRLQIRGYLGDRSAEITLGSLYLNAEETEGGTAIYDEQNFELAIKWYRMAAMGGDKIAQYCLGTIYDSTHYGWPPGAVEAAKWYQLSAEQGYAPAQHDLGGLYLNGQGVEKNFAQCVYWLQKAAMQGHPDAEICLGGRYERGEGVTKDLATAFALYKKSAEGGEIQAARPVWEMYLSGRGTAKDEVAAFAWYRLWTGDSKSPWCKFPLQRQFTDQESQRSAALYKELAERIKFHDDTTPWPLWPR